MLVQAGAYVCGVKQDGQLQYKAKLRKRTAHTEKFWVGGRGMDDSLKAATNLLPPASFSPPTLSGFFCHWPSLQLCKLTFAVALLNFVMLLSA